MTCRVIDCGAVVDSLGLCSRHYQQDWRDRNRENVRASARKSARRYRARMSDEKKRQWAENDRIRKASAEYRAAERDRRFGKRPKRTPAQRQRENEQQRDRRAANPVATRTDKLFRRAGHTPISREYVAILLNDPCSYCSMGGGVVDHIEPIADGGTNDVANLTAACRSCNAQKNDIPLIVFLARRAAKGAAITELPRAA